MGDNSHGEGSIVFFIFKKKIPKRDFLSENKKEISVLHGSVLFHGAAQQTENALTGTAVNGDSCQCIIKHFKVDDDL